MCQKLETGVAWVDGEDRTMKVIREMTYESDNLEGFDCLLIPGTYPLLHGCVLTIKTLYDDRHGGDSVEPDPCTCEICLKVRSKRDAQDESLAQSEQEEQSGSH